MSVGEQDDRRSDELVNPEEQYSLWPAYTEPSPGWNRADTQGLNAECLASIEEAWTDRRPMSTARHSSFPSFISYVSQPG